MKALPITLSDEVAEYLASALGRHVDMTKEASLVWAREGWIGEQRSGPQVILGFFDKGTHPEICLYAFREYVIGVSAETLSQLQGKKLIFEQFRREAAPRSKMTKVIRAVSNVDE
jgi:hypothetical protein